MAQQLRKHGDAQLESQRHNCMVASRPALTPAQQAQQVARAMLDAIKADDKEAARAHAIALRPLMQWLPEEN